VLRRTLRIVQIRLRLPLVLIACGLIVGRWEVFRAYWDRLTRQVAGGDQAVQAVSNEMEFFCPMDPGVVSVWPGRCGVCNMALVRRQRGDTVALPNGVVARMQLTPYRVQLAGIHTTTAEYRPLACEAEAPGIVGRPGPSCSVTVEFSTRAAPWIHDGMEAEVTCDDLPGHSPFSAHLQTVAPDDNSTPGLRRADVVIDDPQRELQTGMVIVAKIRMPMARLEPFRSLPTDPPPLRKDELRLVYICADHRGTVAVKSGRCQIDSNPLEPTRLTEHQRLGWWCPMHPEVTSTVSGSSCSVCGGMPLQPQVVTYSPPGQVLAVPESALVDSGRTAVVFVESMPGMFDGVEVVLGPRSGGYCSVVRGVQAGQRVVTSGAFLLDAETRLTPSLAAGYFGAGSRSEPRAAPSATRTNASAALDTLSPADRTLAEQQKVCPVTRKPLGSMGTPHRVELSGRVIFLCCEGCEEKLRNNPAQFLGKLPHPKSP
jgi:hypothetical protein